MTDFVGGEYFGLHFDVLDVGCFSHYDHLFEDEWDIEGEADDVLLEQVSFTEVGAVPFLFGSCEVMVFHDDRFQGEEVEVFFLQE